MKASNLHGLNVLIEMIECPYLQPVIVDKQLLLWLQPALVAVVLLLYISHPFPSHCRPRNASNTKQRQELNEKRLMNG